MPGAERVRRSRRPWLALSGTRSTAESSRAPKCLTSPRFATSIHNWPMSPACVSQPRMGGPTRRFDRAWCCSPLCGWRSTGAPRASCSPAGSAIINTRLSIASSSCCTAANGTATARLGPSRSCSGMSGCQPTWCTRPGRARSARCFHRTSRSRSAPASPGMAGPLSAASGTRRQRCRCAVRPAASSARFTWGFSRRRSLRLAPR